VFARARSGGPREADRAWGAVPKKVIAPPKWYAKKRVAAELKAKDLQAKAELLVAVAEYKKWAKGRVEKCKSGNCEVNLDFRKVPRLDELNKQTCPSLNSVPEFSKIVGIIFEEFSKLKVTEVRLSYCYKVTDAAITALATHCPKLTKVWINDCNQVTDDAVVALGECKKLHTLDISGCEKITDDAMRKGKMVSL
jgi:hypothetical protein